MKAKIIPLLSRRLVRKKKRVRKRKVDKPSGQPNAVPIPDAVKELDQLKTVDDSRSTASLRHLDRDHKSQTAGTRFRTDESVPAAQVADAIYDQQLSADLQSVMEEIDAGDLDDAAERLDAIIIDAPENRLTDCYALRGYLRLKKGDFPRAEADCSRALEAATINPQVLAWRAAARGEQNKWKLAFDDLQAASDAAASQPLDSNVASGGRRGVYRQLMAEYAMTARKYFQTRIRQKEFPVDLSYERGWMYHVLGENDKARRDFRQSIKMDAQHAPAAAALAQNLLRDLSAEPAPASIAPAMVKKLETRIQRYCQKAILGDIDCQRAAAAVLARMYHRQHASAQKALAIRKMLKLANQNPEHQLAAAAILNELDEGSQVIDLLSPLIQADRRRPSAWRIRGDAWYSLRDDAAACADYNEYLALCPNDVTQIIQRARTEWRQGNPEVAIEDLDHALSLDKTRVDAWLLRGRVCLSMQKTDQAIENARTVTRVENDNPEAHALLADAYTSLEEPVQSAEQLGQAIACSGSDAQVAGYLYQRGMRWHEAGQLEKAATDFRHSLKLRPQHPGTLIWSASTQAKLENWTAAIEDLYFVITRHPVSARQYRAFGKPIAERSIRHYTRQLEQNQKNLQALHGRGTALFILGNFAHAIADFQAILKLDPDNSATHVRCGEALMENHQLNEARACLDRAVEIDPANDWARYCLALTWQRDDNAAKALADLRKAIKLNPQQAVYYGLAAQLAKQSGDRDRQLDALGKAVAHDPTNWHYCFSRGICLLSANRISLAIRDFSRALELDESQMAVRLERGLAFLKSGKTERAITDLEQAVRQNPQSLRAWLGLTQALEISEQFERALILLTKAMPRFGESSGLARLLLARGRVYQEMGRLGPAIIDFSSVVDIAAEQPDLVASALMARGTAFAQLGQLDESRADFENVLPPDKKSLTDVRAALDWIENPTRLRPVFLDPPLRLVRPTRPPQCRQPDKNWLPSKVYNPLSPHEAWVVRLSNDREYGPVRFDILLEWIREGRTDAGTLLLRSDWGRWKPIHRVFPDSGPAGKSELSPEKESANQESVQHVESFPGIKS